MALRIIRVDRQRLVRGRAGQGIALLDGPQAPVRLVAVHRRQAIPCGDVIRGDGQRLLVQRDGLLESLGRALAAEVAGLQEQGISFRVGLLGYGRSAQQRNLELRHYLGGNLVLDGKDIIQRSVISFRPQVIAVLGLDQLDGNAHPVTGLAHGALQHVAHVELCTDLRDLHVLALVGERRGPCHHSQLRNLGQQVKQLLGESVREIFLLCIGTHVDERQHGDGFGSIASRFCSRRFGSKVRLGRNSDRCGGRHESCQHNGCYEQQNDDADQHERWHLSHQLIHDHHSDGQSQHDDDQDIDLATGFGCAGLAAVHVLLALQPLRGYLEDPGEDQRQREAEDENRQDQPYPRGRQFHSVEQDIRDLQYQPGGDDIEDRGLDDVTALEFLVKRHGCCYGLPCSSALLSSSTRFSSFFRRRRMFGSSGRVSWIFMAVTGG